MLETVLKQMYRGKDWQNELGSSRSISGRGKRKNFFKHRSLSEFVDEEIRKLIAGFDFARLEETFF